MLLCTKYQQGSILKGHVKNLVILLDTDIFIPDIIVLSVVVFNDITLWAIHPQLEQQIGQFLMEKVMLYTIFTSFLS